MLTGEQLEKAIVQYFGDDPDFVEAYEAEDWMMCSVICENEAMRLTRHRDVELLSDGDDYFFRSALWSR